MSSPVEQVVTKASENFISGKHWETRYVDDAKTMPSEKGYFVDGKLDEGQKWIYDQEGILMEIQIWKNGKDTGKKGTL